MNKGDFKVIIVGGSIAGLTLAHCLHRVGIDHVVLEKAQDPAPQVGASVGILPNGARILDQLQLYDRIEQLIEPPRLIRQRFGYPIAFLDRQKLLEILYESYPAKGQIKLAAKVTQIDASADNVTVTTSDGTTYIGHLVVGADGVHSPVRSAIWTAAEKENPKCISRREATSLTTEYSCMFGISSPTEGLAVGEQVNAFFDGTTIVTIHGRNGRVYWFVIQKLDRKYTYPDRPRFGPQDLSSVAGRLKHARLTPTTVFGQVWENMLTVSMTPLEEGVFQRWHHRRLVLIGDSAHKMTPNIGQGANLAIEDAAVLTNLIHKQLALLTLPGLTSTRLNDVLQQYRTSRYRRVWPIYQSSRFIVRFQARDGLLNTIFGRYYVPHAGDLPADMASRTIADGVVCDFYPAPNRCGPGWQKYSRGQRWSYSRGFLLCLCILIFLAMRAHY